MKVILLQSLGYSFLALGVLGLFLPFLQGFLFIVIGLLILARHADWAERLLQRFRDQHPKAAQLIDRAEARSHEWGRRAKATFRMWRNTIAAWFRSLEPSRRSTRKRSSGRPDL